MDETNNLNENLEENISNEVEATVEETVEETIEETVEEVATEVAEEVATEAPVEEAPVEETPVEEAPVEEAPAKVETPVKEVAAEVKKAPKKFGAKVIVPIVAAVVVIGGICVVNGAKIANSARKLFMSSEKYTQYVLKDNIKEGTDAMFERLSNANPSENRDYTVTTKVEVSDELIEYICDQAEDSEALEELESLPNSMTVSLETSTYEDMYRVAALLKGPEGNTALTFETILDAEDEMAYVRIPELNDEFLEVDLSENFNRDELELLGERAEALSQKDIKTMRKLVDKYVAIALTAIDDVDESTETVKIEGVSQRFTTLEVELTEELVGNALMAVFDEMLEDDTLADFVDEKLPEDFDYDWDDALDVIDTLNDDLEDADLNDDEMATITLYVDSKGDIKGYAFESDEFEMSAIEIISMGKFAFEFNYETEYGEEFNVTGKGTYVFGKINATFTFETDEFEDLTITLKNAHFSAAKSSGTIIINIEDWCDELGIDHDMPREARDLLDGLTLTIDFNVTTDTYSFVAKLENSDKMSVTVSIETTTKVRKDPIEVPDDTEDDVDEWINDFDTDAIEDILINLGYDEDFAENIGDEIAAYAERAQNAADQVAATYEDYGEF